MLTGLFVIRATSFKTTVVESSTSFKTTVVQSMIRTAQSTWKYLYSSNHVLDEIKMSRSINDSAVLLGGLKISESNISGDTQHPHILEGHLVHIISFLLEALNHTLVSTTKIVDQVSSQRGQ